jgi:RNA polymerase sigma-70 factor (ECF subfamily)
MVETSASLLDRVRGEPDGLAWQRWHVLYEPLIHGWLRKQGLLSSDRDDVVQNVLTVVVRRIPEFHHNQRTGAFRHWLKSITINCLRDYWKQRRQHPRSADALGVLDAWEDDSGALSREWAQEHDRQVVQRLLALLEPEFTPATWQAFRMVVLEYRPVAEAARELNLSTNAVYIAKSRVLTRLRQEAAGLVDEAGEN